MGITEDGANLYRYKGVLAVKGKDEKRESRFVFIGKNLDTEFLKMGFDACLVSNELRFKVGDKVMANVGKFTNGTVLAQWDDGNAYRVRLDDGTEVWAPIDIDAYIRPAK